MVVWYFILQLPMQSVPITTNVVEFESRSWRGVLDTTISDEVCPVTCSMSVFFFRVLRFPPPIKLIATV
jgi:hypothetical protein